MADSIDGAGDCLRCVMFGAGDPARAGLECAPSGEQIEDEDDDGEHEKDVNPAAQGVTADQPEKPQYDQNDGDCPKHVLLFS
jgi:hypothetical protein